MECNSEFCRVTEQHTAVDCINTLKKENEHLKDLCEQWGKERDKIQKELEEWKGVVEPLKKEVDYLSTMWNKNSKLTDALIRARDQLAMYKADYTVKKINEVLDQ